MSEDFNEGLAYINMAKKYKLSFNRIKGLNKFMRKLQINEDPEPDEFLDRTWAFMNRKQILHEKINAE